MAGPTNRPRVATLALLAALALPVAVGAAGGARAGGQEDGSVLDSVVVATSEDSRRTGFDGHVEAVRQTVVASQVAGAVVALEVRAGDRVKAGQVLARLDARAAEQQAGALAAQVRAARASAAAASTEYERQRLLHDKQYVSQAALERAEAQYKTAAAKAAAEIATAEAARTETGYFLVKAPYDGMVSDVAVTQGDMAMPGRALMTVHDPAVLRVAAAIPESAIRRLQQPGAGSPQVELPATGRPPLVPSRWSVLPAGDPATHTIVLWLDLPQGTEATPGMFARAWLPPATGGPDRITIPTRAVVQRAELKAVYVLTREGRALLRQVRLGPAEGDQVEVLSGLAVGERVAVDPQAAARLR